MANACAGLCRDLRSIGGLPTLLALLQSPESSLRWRAADVIGTSAQNNSPVQQVCTDSAVVPVLSSPPVAVTISERLSQTAWLLPFMSHPDVSCEGNEHLLVKHRWCRL